MWPSTGPLLHGSRTAPSTRTEIAPECPHEPLQRVDVGGVRPRQPAVQGRHLAHAQNGAETQHQAPHRREARTLRLQRIHGVRLAIGQERARLAEQRGRDLR